MLKRHRLPILFIILVTLLAIHQTLNFYFWHDDFTIFHDIRINQCNLKWPYQSYCTIFSFLYKIFGYAPAGYFALGVLLAIICTICFYFLLLQFFPLVIALVTSLVFGVFYFGAGTFLESYDSIFTFASLSLLFSSLILIKRAELSKDYIFSLLAFGISVLFFQARSSTYFIPFLTIYWFYSRHKLIHKIIYTLIVFLIFWLTFIVLPSSIFLPNLGSGNQSILQQINIVVEIKELLITVGSFIIPEGIFNFFGDKIKSLNYANIRLTSATIASLIFLVAIISNRKNNLIKVQLFSIVLLTSLYLPFGLRSEFDFPSTHRYLFFLVPGALIAWSSFYKYKWWRFISVICIAILFILTSKYFYKANQISILRKSFYTQLHANLAGIPKGSVLYFYPSPSFRHQFDDFLRVGGLPSEGSIASEYAVSYKDFSLIVDSHTFADEIKKDFFNISKLYTFYYDGKNLINTTDKSRNLLVNGYEIPPKNLNITATTSIDQTKELWIGSNRKLNFGFDELRPLVPFNLSFIINASLIRNLPFPYSQNCLECNYSASSLSSSLLFLTKSRELKQQLRIQVNNSGDGTKAENLNDGYQQTYWVPSRQKWFMNDFPLFTFEFSDLISADGFIFYSGSTARLPKKLEISVDGKPVSYTIATLEPSIAKVLFEINKGKKIEMKIIESIGGDIPIINRLEIIPDGFSDIDMSKVDSIRDFPAGNIDSQEEIKLLENYLTSGTPACITWQNENGDKGSVDFILYLDGKDHEYQIPITTIGGQSPPQFELGCLSYPLELKLQKAQISL